VTAGWTRAGGLWLKDGIPFVEIPGGTWVRGLSPANAEALEAIRERAELGEGPTIDLDILDLVLAALGAPSEAEATVGPFLLAREPLSPEDAARLGLSLTPQGGLTEEGVAELLRITGARLPSESEWEWAARGGTTTLWHGGDDLPPESEITAPRPHPYGLLRMGHGYERCADGWFPRQAGAPLDGSPRPGHGWVLRGGAGNVPWQGNDEWLGLLPCMRMPWTDLPAAWGSTVRLAAAGPTGPQRGFAP
jgi:hypothetical protein